MLNYFLYHLAGPKSLELKVILCCISDDFQVKDPQRFHFNPRLLLSTVVGIYLQMTKIESFVPAIVKDGRSFTIDIFHRAIVFLRRENLLPEVEPLKLNSFEQNQISEFENLVKQIEVAHAAVVDDEEGEMFLFCF